MLWPARFPSASRSAHSFRLRTSQAAELKSHHHALWWQHFSAYLQAVMFTSFLKLLCFNYNFTIKMPLRFRSYESAPCLTERQGALKSCILNPSISRGMFCRLQQNVIYSRLSERFYNLSFSFADFPTLSLFTLSLFTLSLFTLSRQPF